ncbi:glutathione S-transferase [Lipomyces arxii]|uniref:glutathione S-transferase n=1 Tax=Lipomyces arxii TaxID=56418 RepID=UPI0034CFDF6C
MSTPDLTLYTAAAPNGIKISMALEFLELPYKVQVINLTKMEQKTPEFLAINPNGRIPALVDVIDGKQVNLMESGAILLYLTDKYDPEYKLSYPFGSKEYYEVLEWLFFQVGGLGPMLGQSLHFMHYCATANPDVINYGVNRYQNEVRRLFGVLNTRLEKQKAAGSKFLVGDHLSIADLANLGWVLYDTYGGIESTDYSALNEWQDMLSAMPLVHKGMDVPAPFKIKELAKDKASLELVANAGREWISKQMLEQAIRK